jgi:hypothetical protein
LAYGGPFVWLAILLFRSSRVLAWLNWVGIVGGLGGFVWIANFVPVPPLGPIPLLLNIVLGMAWLIGVTYILVRTNDATIVQPADRGAASAVAFSPDGHTLAGSSDDNTVRLWPTEIDALLAMVDWPLQPPVHRLTTTQQQDLGLAE